MLGWTVALVPFVLSLASGAPSHAPFGPALAQGRVTFTNNERFLFDVDGNQIDAYGSKINFFNGLYYLYGSSFSATGVQLGIKSYSSVDLEHWQYEGYLVEPSSDSPCSTTGACGRPHIVYNSKTNTYVLWANAGSDGYVVGTSSSPSGPFTVLSERAAIDPQFNGLQPADFTVERFGDKAYIVFSALNFADPRAGSIWPPIYQTIHASELTDDFLNTTRVSYRVASLADDLIDQETESPDLFQRNGLYYVAASNTCSYCNGSIGLLYRSESIQGPWTRQIISDYSCNGQLEGVLPLTDPHTGHISYVWHSTSVPGGPRTAFSGHIFQPLSFLPDGSVEPLNCSRTAQFPVDFTLGEGGPASGAAIAAVDGSPLDVVYNPVCDADQFDLFQTWRARKAGRLESVSVNFARAQQTVPLLLTVFKFPSYDELVAPGFKWTQLAAITVNATQLNYTFDVTSIALGSNATVQTGDLLGLAILQGGTNLGFPIAGNDVAPYCHLEYDAAEDSDVILYQRGVGQNSWRGLRGNVSPVYQRIGKGVKFFVTYAQV